MDPSIPLVSSLSSRARAGGAFGLAVAAAYVPTLITLANGPWDTEQEGHGPFILAAAAWIAWQSRSRVPSHPAPAPGFGWASLIAGLLMMIVGRSQEILLGEVLSIIPVIAGAVLIVGGWGTLRALAFPIGLLVFCVPLPGWMMDAVTVPLKAALSDVATSLIYALGYPVAQNGVMIMIGAYQLLVKDACAGMNSIFALSAIGFLYVYLMQHASPWRNALLIASIPPIALGANLIRVLVLILVAYHVGPNMVEGVLHDIAGVMLFATSFALIVLLDGIVGIVGAAARGLAVFLTTGAARRSDLRAQKRSGSFRPGLDGASSEQG